MRRRRIDPSDPTPLYSQVAEILRARIATGEYGPGDLLPSERKLADEYQVSHDTIRDTLAVLRREGLIITRRGQGSLVRFEQEPLVIWVEDGTIQALMPTEDQRRRMGLPEGEPLIVISRPGQPDEVVRGGPGTIIKIGDGAEPEVEGEGSETSPPDGE